MAHLSLPLQPFLSRNYLLLRASPPSSKAPLPSMEGQNNFSFFNNSDQNYSNFLFQHDLQYPLSTLDSTFTRSQNINNIIFPQQQNPLNNPPRNVLNLQAFPSFSTASFVDQSRQEHLSLLNHLIVDLQKDLRDDLTNNSSSNVRIRHGSNKIKKTKEGGTSAALCIKGQWSEEEDRKIVDLHKVYGRHRKWALISEQIEGRSGKQCRERWVNHLRPHIKKNAVWSESEEQVIVAVHKLVGNKWAEIARFIPERSENSIKNHWNTTKRRQSSKRKFRRQHETQDGAKPSTVLEDYIRGKYFNNEASTSNSGNNPSDSPAISAAAAASNDRNNPEIIDLTVSSPEYEEEEPNFHEIFTEDYNQEMNFFETLFHEEDKSASKRLKANGDNSNVNDTSNPSPLPAQMTLQNAGNGLLNSSSGFSNMEGSSGSIFINTAQNFEYASSFQPAGTYFDDSNVVGSYGDIYDHINFG